MAELPDTVLEGCDAPDCEDDFNLLSPFLFVTVKAKRNVLLIQTEEPGEDPNEVPEDEVLLGTKSGRGVMLRFHNFDCFRAWVTKREGLSAKLEYHREDDIYVPEDNRSPEELVEDGEMHPALATALAEIAEPEGDES